jgi:hypothetical protein
MDKNINEAQEQCTIHSVSCRAFTYEWWKLMSEKAKWKFNNLAWHSRYYDIAYYCHQRAIQSSERHGS